VLAPYNAAPHNRYQPHPAEPAQHTTCSNTRLGLLKMGIMMPETCWKIVHNKHLTVASCWFSLSQTLNCLYVFVDDEWDGHTVHKLSQRRLTADWLAPRDSDCWRMHSKVSSDRLPSYIKATRPVLEIFKTAGYLPDGPRICSCLVNRRTIHNGVVTVTRLEYACQNFQMPWNNSKKKKYFSA